MRHILNRNEPQKIQKYYSSISSIHKIQNHTQNTQTINKLTIHSQNAQIKSNFPQLTNQAPENNQQQYDENYSIKFNFHKTTDSIKNH